MKLFKALPLLPLLMLCGIAQADEQEDQIREADTEVQSHAAIRKLKSEDSNHEFKESQAGFNGKMDSVKFQHYYQGIEVIGSLAIRHNYHRKKGTGRITRVKRKLATWKKDS